MSIKCQSFIIRIKLRYMHNNVGLLMQVTKCEHVKEVQKATDKSLDSLSQQLNLLQQVYFLFSSKVSHMLRDFRIYFCRLSINSCK